jgi:hypothetical protein
MRIPEIDTVSMAAAAGSVACKAGHTHVRPRRPVDSPGDDVTASIRERQTAQVQALANQGAARPPFRRAETGGSDAGPAPE